MPNDPILPRLIAQQRKVDALLRAANVARLIGAHDAADRTMARLKDAAQGVDIRRIGREGKP